MGFERKDEGQCRSTSRVAGPLGKSLSHFGQGLHPELRHFPERWEKICVAFVQATGAPGSSGGRVGGRGCGTVTPGEAMRRGPADGEDSRVIDAMVGVRSGAVKRLGETCKSLGRPEGDDRGTGGLATGFWGGSDRCGRMKQKVWQMVSQRNLDVEAIQPELQRLGMTEVIG